MGIAVSSNDDHPPRKRLGCLRVVGQHRHGCLHAVEGRHRHGYRRIID